MFCRKIPSLEPTSLNELLEKRFHHVETEWPNHPFFRVLITEGSMHCYDHVKSLINLDEINSVKNRRKKSSEEENSNTINPYWMLYGLSYVDEMLIERRILRHGLVNIGSTAYDFYYHCNFREFTDDLLMEHTSREHGGRQTMTKAIFASAITQRATGTNSSRSSRDSVNTPRPNKSENVLSGIGARDNFSEHDRDEAQSCTGLCYGIGEYFITRDVRSQRSRDTSNHAHPSSIARAPNINKHHGKWHIDVLDFGENHRWQILTQQLGFHNRLIVAWGDFLPSIFQLLTIAFRLGKGINIWGIETDAVSLAIGIDIRTININSRYVSRIDGEPNIFPRDLFDALLR